MFTAWVFSRFCWMIAAAAPSAVPDEGEDGGEGAATSALSAKPDAKSGAAQNAAQDALDRMDAEAALADAAEALLAPLMADLEAGLTPAELQARRGELYPQMDDAQLADVLARAMFVAEVWGHAHG